MNKILVALAFIISVDVGAMGYLRRAPVPPVEPPASSTIDVSEPSTSIEAGVRIEAKVAGGKEYQVTRIVRLVPVAEKVINTPEFKNRVLGAWYQGKAQFVQNLGLTNAQVYERIMNGNELGTGNDGIWQMEFKLESARCSTLGWTYPTVKTVWFNTCNFDNRDDSGVVGTICHEQMHKLGFDHDKKNTARREYSVPYAVGTICAELARPILAK